MHFFSGILFHYMDVNMIFYKPLNVEYLVLICFSFVNKSVYVIFMFIAKDLHVCLITYCGNS